MHDNPYPEKPELQENQRQTNWGATIFSIVLFMLVFMFLFSNELLFIIGLILALCLHEFGHFIMMKRFHYSYIRLLFIPLMGAFVQGKKEEYSQRESLFVVGAGPFPGLIVGFLLMLFSQQINSVVCFQMGMLFFLLNIINLVPLDPLDGGQLLKLIFRKKHEQFLLIFTLLASLSIIGIGFYFDSYLLTLFGFLMGFRVRALQKTHYLHRQLSDENIPFFTTYKQLSDKDYWKIKQIILDNRSGLKEYSMQHSSAQTDLFIASQVNAILITPTKKDASFLLICSLVIFWLICLVSPFLLWYLLDLNWVHYAVNNWNF